MLWAPDWPEVRGQKEVWAQSSPDSRHGELMRWGYVGVCYWPEATATGHLFGRNHTIIFK